LVDVVESVDSGGLALRARRPEPGVLVVEVCGEVDMTTAPSLEGFLEQTVAAAPTRAVIVDLSDVSFIGSHGLSVLLALREGGSVDGATLFLAGLTANRRVSRVLEVAGVAALFETCDLDGHGRGETGVRWV
jgi:anti-sigma B factor antagonist